MVTGSSPNIIPDRRVSTMCRNIMYFIIRTVLSFLNATLNDLFILYDIE